MTHTYVDLATVQTTDPGDPLTAAWCDQVRDNQEVLRSPPACSANNSGVQSVATGTMVVLTANSETFDNDSMHSTTSSTSRITAQTAGRYLIAATVHYAAAGGRRITRFLLNGTTAIEGDSRASAQQAGASGVVDRVSVVRSVVLSVGDYLEVQVNQNSGGNLDVTLDEFLAVSLTQ